ncbi:hypothetical protein SISSUDRAFT_584541 [Sistotremastrum suecicum HHB10207 ss-3]|uniref:Uncharacterized protein n=1 Tax=Sistotremastrum suecicum HHB10207 ss-3 TaxID=1314776 RepID=A0A165XEQ3_9AGAM|nr:hypothetical protein SISSUDRAFT_584541 [Sistotremastrum suecicum HHB10207 ss-3]
MWSDFCKHMVLERLEECCLVRGRMIFSQAYTPIKHVQNMSLPYDFAPHLQTLPSQTSRLPLSFGEPYGSIQRLGQSHVVDGVKPRSSCLRLWRVVAVKDACSSRVATGAIHPCGSRDRRFFGDGAEDPSNLDTGWEHHQMQQIVLVTPASQALEFLMRGWPF